MKTRLIIALLAVAGAAAEAGAQSTATYQIVFTSNAPGTIGSGTNAIRVPSGAVVNATVLVSLDPGIGAPTPSGPVRGLADGGFRISGSGPAGIGSWSNHTIPAPYNFLYGPATTAGTIAGFNVSGAIWGTGSTGWLPPGLTNPDDVWTGVFTSGAAGAGTVNFGFTSLVLTTVWVGQWNGAWCVCHGVTYTSDPGAGGSITVTGCYPDCDASGTLNAADFTCFQTRFVASDPYADCDGNTQFTVADFTCFQTAFVAGCP